MFKRPSGKIAFNGIVASFILIAVPVYAYPPDCDFIDCAVAVPEPNILWLFGVAGLTIIATRLLKRK